MSIWKESFLAALHCLLIKHWCFIDSKLGMNSRNPTTAENEKKNHKTLSLSLNYFISYHPTRKLSLNISFEKQNSFSHIHGSVCIDTKRIISDGCHAQMAVSHDGVESLQHVARGGGSFICGRSWFLLTEDKAHWLKSLQLWAKCQQEWGWKWNQQLLPGGFHSANERGVLGWPALTRGPNNCTHLWR